MLIAVTIEEVEGGKKASANFIRVNSEGQLYLVSMQNMKVPAIGTERDQLEFAATAAQHLAYLIPPEK